MRNRKLVYLTITPEQNEKLHQLAGQLPDKTKIDDYAQQLFNESLEKTVAAHGEPQPGPDLPHYNDAPAVEKGVVETPMNEPEPVEEAPDEKDDKPSRTTRRLVHAR